MTAQEAYTTVKSLLPLVPKIVCGYTVDGSVIHQVISHPLVEKGIYRGRSRFMVGYRWHRPYSNALSGSTYPRVLGYGDTYAEAIAMMKRKLEKGFKPEQARTGGDGNFDISGL